MRLWRRSQRDADVTAIHDVVIIGGGIVGLSLARAILDAEPRGRVRVLDKEPQLGEHASGRNSGVLHAGFYYAPDSLKARLTRRGNVLLHELCEGRGVPVRRCGKVVVAQTSDELPALLELKRRADANGVPVDLVDESELARLEPLARTHSQALWSPTTSVAAPVAVLAALSADVIARGATVSTSSEAVAAGPGWVRTRTETMSTGHVINAAGLFADRVGRWFGMCDDYAMLPFKGLYLYGRWQPGRLMRHVYPVPDPRNPFLGVHLTVTVDGRVKIGPTALPALWRESYGGWKGFSLRDTAAIAKVYPRFLRSPHHDVPGLLRTELPKHLRRHLVQAAKRLVPSLDAADFKERGRPGIRAQLLHLPTQRLEMDFVLRGDASSTHVLNAVSPAWTSSLAVAEHVVDDMRTRGVL
jgi:L-2-hydroxyglutarate oxidase LhgO